MSNLFFFAVGGGLRQGGSSQVTRTNQNRRNEDSQVDHEQHGASLQKIQPGKLVASNLDVHVVNSLGYLRIGRRLFIDVFELFQFQSTGRIGDTVMVETDGQQSGDDEAEDQRYNGCAASGLPKGTECAYVIIVGRHTEVSAGELGCWRFRRRCSRGHDRKQRPQAIQPAR